jgi:glyoxylase-like metal-dependent hydrolase (beta-lactamase superfamily II)
VAVASLVGDAGNIVVQTGMRRAARDSGAGTLAEKTLARVRQLSEKPIQYILNTGFQPEHTGGNRAAASGGDRASAVRSLRCSSLMPASARRSSSIGRAEPHGRRRRPAAGVPSDACCRSAAGHFTAAMHGMFWEPRAVTDGDSISPLPPRGRHRHG